LAFVPESIANRLANTNLVFAIDVSHANLEPFLALVPAQFSCARELVKSTGVIVIAEASPFVAYASNLPQDGTRKCLEQLTPLLGATTGSGADGSYEVRMADGGVSLLWQSDVVTIREVGSPPPPSGPASAEIRGLVAQVPANASAFLLSAGFPERKIKNVVLWLRAENEELQVMIRAQGTEAGVVKPWLHATVEGFKKAAIAKNITVDDAWVKETLAEPIGTVEIRVPVSVFRQGN